MTVEEALEIFKNTLDIEMKNSIRNVYNEWTKEPIDTGLMLETTSLVGVDVDIENMVIKTFVNTTDYSKYVRQGWGTNVKYGARNFINSALKNDRVVGARNQLLNLMFQKSMELGGDRLAVKNIKINL